MTIVRTAKRSTGETRENGSTRTTLRECSPELTTSLCLATAGPRRNGICCCFLNDSSSSVLRARVARLRLGTSASVGETRFFPRRRFPLRGAWRFANRARGEGPGHSPRARRAPAPPRCQPEPGRVRPGVVDARRADGARAVLPVDPGTSPGGQALGRRVWRRACQPASASGSYAAE